LSDAFDKFGLFLLTSKILRGLMIEISQKGFVVKERDPINRWKEEFRQNHCVVLPRVLEKVLLKKIISDLETSFFSEKEHVSNNETFATDLSVTGTNKSLHIIHLLLNNPGLFRVIEEITGCGPVKAYSGRIYRNMPGTEHRLDWHSDTEEPFRLVGISINLSSGTYEGGVFQIRKSDSGTILREVKCQDPGAAHIFRVSPHLEHRVTVTTGEVPRTAAAGWFLSSPNPGLKLYNR
jgi:hypothetical protein